MTETFSYGKNIILNHLTKILRLNGHLKTTVVPYNPTRVNIVGKGKILSVAFNETANSITITVDQLTTDVAINVCAQLQKELPGLNVELDAKPAF